MTQKTLHAALEASIPATLSADWDNDGAMLLPCPMAEVKKVLVALDCTEAVANAAIAGGYDAILTHHPLIFKPLRGVTDPMLVSLLRAGIAVYSYHTRLDALDGGVNDALSALLSLQAPTPFGEDGMGRIGTLPAPLSPRAFGALVKTCLNAPSITAYLATREISRVALLGGSGKDAIADAVRAGADAFLTGEIPYNAMLDATRAGISLYAAGHYATEQPVCTVLAALVRSYGILADILPSCPLDVL